MKDFSSVDSRDHETYFDCLKQSVATNGDDRDAWRLGCQIWRDFPQDVQWAESLIAHLARLDANPDDRVALNGVQTACANSMAVRMAFADQLAECEAAQ